MTNPMLPVDIDPRTLPKCVAIVMDGNGRWAIKRGLPRIEGHRRGVETVKEIIRTCGEIGIGTLILYTFSAENWSRPRPEVDALMLLLQRTLIDEVDDLARNNVRLGTIGRTAGLPESVRVSLEAAIEKLSHNTGLHVVSALNYGARSEIVDAAREIVDQVINKKLPSEQIDEALITSHLYTRTIPDPDLFIRVGGEYRLSNFLLWQVAYSEIYVTPTFWPDFNSKGFFDALRYYQERKRSEEDEQLDNP